jgi:hypothetical protein
MTNQISESEKFQAMLPVFFSLASTNWSVDRKQVSDEEWVELLPKGLTPAEFDQYENWWFSPDGWSVIQKLMGEFINSILALVVEEARKPLRGYLEGANWPDFIRELADCSPGDGSYFVEYAVEQGLCWQTDFEVLEEIDIDQESFNELLEYWFDKSSEEINNIFLSAYSDIAKIR